MAVKTARVEWTGDFKTGQGTIVDGNGAFETQYSYASIFSDAPGTSPTEILGASLAGCFSGALAAYLSRANFSPARICTDAAVHLEPTAEGFRVARIHLNTQAEVPGIDESTFLATAEHAKSKCPVSMALEAIEITLNAVLL